MKSVIYVEDRENGRGKENVQGKRSVRNPESGNLESTVFFENASF